MKMPSDLKKLLFFKEAASFQEIDIQAVNCVFLDKKATINYDQ